MQLDIEAQCSHCKNGLLISRVFFEGALGTLSLQVDPCFCRSMKACTECEDVAFFKELTTKQAETLATLRKEKAELLLVQTELRETVRVANGIVEELKGKLARWEAYG